LPFLATAFLAGAAFLAPAFLAGAAFLATFLGAAFLAGAAFLGAITFFAGARAKLIMMVRDYVS